MQLWLSATRVLIEVNLATGANVSLNTIPGLSKSLGNKTTLILRNTTVLIFVRKANLDTRTLAFEGTCLVSTGVKQ